MKRLFACLLTCVLALSGLAVSAGAETVINGIDKDYPPFAFINEKGEVAGFDVESINWIADKMGFAVEHKPFEWKSIIQMVVENKIQMVCSGLSITPERAEQVLFSDPYWVMRKIYVVRKGSDVTMDTVLHGKVRLGVQQGTNEVPVLQDMVKKGEADFTITQYATPSDAIADLMNGRLTVAVMDTAPAANAMKLGQPVMELGTFGEIDRFGVAINKKNPELLKKINEGYKLLKADPYWEELKAKYNPAGSDE